MPSMRDGFGVACAAGLLALGAASLLCVAVAWAGDGIGPVAALACAAAGVALLRGGFDVLCYGNAGDCRWAALAGGLALAGALAAGSAVLAALAAAYVALAGTAYVLRPIRA